MTLNVHIYPSAFTNESRILRESHSLIRFGFFTSIELVGKSSPGLPPIEQLENGIKIVRLDPSAPRTGGLIWKLWSNLRWSLAVYRRFSSEEIACINCHSVSSLPLCTILKYRTGAPLVYDAHELETESNGLTGIRKLASKAVERALIGSVDYSIFVGSAIHHWYQRHYGLERSAVVLNCPRRTQVASTTYFRDHFGISSDHHVFLYQGVISTGRGIRPLIDAFRDLGDSASLIFMGYGPSIDCLTREIHGLSNIFYHAAVPPAELLSYTASADFGISLIESTSLSYEYCMPNKLFEYLMAGVPVLVSSTEEQRKLVEQYNVGIVCNGTSPERIRSAVRELWSMDQEKLMDAIRKAQQIFNWEAQEDTLRLVYESLGFTQLVEPAR